MYWILTNFPGIPASIVYREKNEYYWRSPYNKQFIETDIIVGFVFCGFFKVWLWVIGKNHHLFSAGKSPIVLTLIQLINRATEVQYYIYTVHTPSYWRKPWWKKVSEKHMYWKKGFYVLYCLVCGGHQCCHTIFYTARKIPFMFVRV
jgi:hypothetical protein